VVKAAGFATCLLIAVASIAAAQTPRPPSAPIVGGAPNGRFQIVNGTPEMSRNIMLLDTVTGDTWLYCTLVGGSAGWCKMSRSEVGTVTPEKPERQPPRFIPDPPPGFVPKPD
jgi:hypothetical protein